MLKNMKNRYPKACEICQGTVPAGEGTLRRTGSGWSVTHEFACPRDAIRHGHARAHTRRILDLLDRPTVPRQVIADCVDALAQLVRTRWASRESCERAILSARAFADVDRLAVEEILHRFLPEDSRC